MLIIEDRVKAAMSGLDCVLMVECKRSFVGRGVLNDGCFVVRSGDESSRVQRGIDCIDQVALLVFEEWFV